MTCEYSNTNQHDALYNVARKYPGGVDAVAQRMDVSVNVLRNKLRSAIDTHHTYFEEASVIIELAEEARMPTAFAPLHAFCWRHGHVAFKMPKGDVDSDALLKQVVDVIGDQGNLVNSISGALATGNDIDRREFFTIEQNIMTCINALVVLREKVAAKHKADCAAE
jgi:hypothetical protein